MSLLGGGQTLTVSMPLFPIDQSKSISPCGLAETSGGCLKRGNNPASCFATETVDGSNGNASSPSQSGSEACLATWSITFRRSYRADGPTGPHSPCRRYNRQLAVYLDAPRRLVLRDAQKPLLTCLQISHVRLQFARVARTSSSKGCFPLPSVCPPLSLGAEHDTHRVRIQPPPSPDQQRRSYSHPPTTSCIHDSTSRKCCQQQWNAPATPTCDGIDG